MNEFWIRKDVSVIELVGKYPYINNTGKLKKFIEKIPKMGDPLKITQPTLPKFGFGSPNDRPIVPILQFIGFLNDRNETTQDYKDFRIAGKAKTVMASALKKAYSDLFGLYPDAYEVDDQSLKDFFTPTTDGGEEVVNLTTATFKALCSFADFKAIPEQGARKGGEEEKPEGRKGKTPPTLEGVTINLNIQLTLPVADNEKVYENIFKALRDNLLSQESRAD
jgi:hypothetical protein